MSVVVVVVVVVVHPRAKITLKIGPSVPVPEQMPWLRIYYRRIGTRMTTRLVMDKKPKLCSGQNGSRFAPFETIFTPFDSISRDLLI